MAAHACGHVHACTHACPPPACTHAWSCTSMHPCMAPSRMHPCMAPSRLPAGTGDAQLNLAQRIPLSGALLVSTPQDLALSDVRRCACACKHACMECWVACMVCWCHKTQVGEVQCCLMTEGMVWCQGTTIHACVMNGSAAHVLPPAESSRLGTTACACLHARGHDPVCPCMHTAGMCPFTQQASLHACRGAAMFQKLRVPLMGMVENMSWHTCRCVWVYVHSW